MKQLSRSTYERICAAVAHQFTTYLLPATVALSVFIALAIYHAHGWTQWQRFIPLLHLVVGSALAALATWQGRRTLGAQLLLGSMIIATTIGTLLNGVGGPAWWGNLPVLLLVVTLAGLRGGLIYVVWMVISGGAWFWLHEQGWTSGLMYTSPALAYAMVCLFGLMGSAFISVPQRLLHEALQQSEERLEHLKRSELAFEAVFDQAGALLALLQPDGTLVRLNRRARAQIDQSSQSLPLGMRLQEGPWWSPQQRQALEALMHSALEGQPQQGEFTFPLGEHHQRRTFTLLFSPYTTPQGQVEYLLAQATEITEQVRERESLHHSQRMEALGQLLGGVAHDFNNMLGAIQISASLMRAEPGMVDTPERLELVDMVEGASARASNLTRQLLSFGRRDQIQVEDIDLKELVQESCQLFRRTLGRGLTVELTTDAPALFIHGDRHALQNALLNLAINARDAMEGQGTLRLRLGWRPEAEPPLALLDIQDEGPGVPEHLAEHIFRPFFTTKPDGAGTGLGLAAVHSTVHAHLGQIELRDASQGAHFHIELPCYLQEEAPLKEARARSAALPHLGGRVLLVDDETLLRQATGRLLESVQVQVAEASDAQAALALLGGASAPFSLALVDLRMPGVNGVELARALHRDHPQLPVVLMSGYVDKDITPELPQARDYTLLRKPFSRQELLQAIAPWLQDGGDQVRRASPP